MSRRLLMGAGSSTAPIVPTDPENPDPDPSEDQWLEGWPATDDPILRRLRPTGLEPTIVDTGHDGDDVGALLEPLIETVDNSLLTPYGSVGPRDHGILFLEPGVYRGGFGTGGWLSIVGTTGNPDDVIIFSDTEDADGVIHPYGPIHVEGVTLKAGFSETLQKSPKYCAHIAGSQRSTFANVIFDASDGRSASFGCAGTVGCDGNVGAVVTFYKCKFIRQNDLAGTDASAMNMHGGPAGILPMKVSFIDCDMPNGGGFGGGGTNYGANDELYVIGGTLGADITTSDTTDTFTDHDNIVRNPGFGGVGTVTRNHTEWPIPDEDDKAGLIPMWDSFYEPEILETLGTTFERASVTDAAPMTPVAGRTYYAPVPIMKGMWLNRYGLKVHSGAGKMMHLIPEPDPGVYYGAIETADRPESLSIDGATPITNGDFLAGYHYSWILYPRTLTEGRGNRLWVKFRFDDSTGVSIDGSASLPGLHDCYYSDDNGTTLVKAAAGTPFPLAHAAQVR